jgi:uncharacterized membrane protein
MKILTLLFIVIATALIVFNATQLDLNTPFEGQSMIAIITIAASLCVILMMLILRTSKRIEQKTKEKK